MILGFKCKDKISGFEGVAVSVHTYINGCSRVTLQPLIDKDGKLPDTQTFDLPQLTMQEKVTDIGNQETGGPEKYSDKRNY
jgi:hypothetical protein